MRRGYWIAQFDIIDRQKFEIFREAGIEAVERVGGRILARTSDLRPISGKTRERVVIVEFDTYDDAWNAWHDPVHQGAWDLLRAICDYDVIIIPGDGAHGVFGGNSPAAPTPQAGNHGANLRVA